MMYTLYTEQHVGVYALGEHGRHYVRMRLRDLIAKLQLQLIDVDDICLSREIIAKFDCMADNVASPDDYVLVAKAIDLLQKYTDPALRWRVGISALRLEKCYGEEE